MSRGARDSPAASGQVAAQQRGTPPGSLRRLLGCWPGEAGGGGEVSWRSRWTGSGSEMVMTGDTPSACLMLLIPILQRQTEVTQQPAQGRTAREQKTQGMSSDVLLRGCTLPPLPPASLVDIGPLIPNCKLDGVWTLGSYLIPTATL